MGVAGGGVIECAVKEIELLIITVNRFGDDYTISKHPRVSQHCCKMIRVGELIEVILNRIIYLFALVRRQFFHRALVKLGLLSDQRHQPIWQHILAGLDDALMNVNLCSLPLSLIRLDKTEDAKSSKFGKRHHRSVRSNDIHRYRTNQKSIYVSW